MGSLYNQWPAKLNQQTSHLGQPAEVWASLPDRIERERVSPQYTACVLHWAGWDSCYGGAKGAGSQSHKNNHAGSGQWPASPSPSSPSGPLQVQLLETVGGEKAALGLMFCLPASHRRLVGHWEPSLVT